MAASASSQFRLVLLFSIGTLLLLTMAPQFGSALECYKQGKLPQVGVRAAWTENHLLGLLEMPTPNGSENAATEQCPADKKYCLSFYCRRISKEWAQGCAKVPPNLTPSAYLEALKQYCGQSSSFAGQICHDSDKCNKWGIKEVNEKANANAEVKTKSINIVDVRVTA